MNNNIKRIVFITTIILIFGMMYGAIYAASIGISVGYSTITVGGSTTMTISGNDAIGKVSITSSNPNVVEVSQSSLWLEGSANITLTTKSVGEATVTVSSVDMSDGAGNIFSGSKSITITSKPVYIDTRSDNNYLTSITLGNDIKLNEEFSRDNLEYTATVPYDLSVLDVVAELEDDTASYSVNNNQDLKVGENIVTIDVHSENEEVQTYTIKVTKEEDPEAKNTFLKTLEVSGANLRNAFNKETYFYLAEDVYSDVDSIKVVATPEVKDAKVEISGNDKLKLGLNVIEIKVTSKDESTSVKYRIEVFKSEEVLNLVDVEEDNTQKNFFKEYWTQLLLGGIVVVELIIILVLISKKEENRDDKTKHYDRKKDYEEGSDKTSDNYFDGYNHDITLENEEVTEDTLKYSDPERNDTRRHRRNI